MLSYIKLDVTFRKLLDEKCHERFSTYIFIKNCKQLLFFQELSSLSIKGAHIMRIFILKSFGPILSKL